MQKLRMPLLDNRIVLYAIGADHVPSDDEVSDAIRTAFSDSQEAQQQFLIQRFDLPNLVRLTENLLTNPDVHVTASERLRESLGADRWTAVFPSRMASIPSPMAMFPSRMPSIPSQKTLIPLRIAHADLTKADPDLPRADSDAS